MKVFRVGPEQRIIIPTASLKSLRSYAQLEWSQPESGGVLLGRHLLDNDDVVVDEITSPQRGDRQSRTGFFRGPQHQAIANQRWKSSGGTIAYLGSWHTHPENDPMFSPTDRRDWEQAVRRDKFPGDRLFFVIVGMRRTRVWTMNRNFQLEQLKEERRGDKN